MNARPLFRTAARASLRTALATLALVSASTGYTAEKLTLVLNWTPKADHAPYFYALKNGWYAKGGVDLNIEGGRGSGATVQRLAAGAADIGLADMSVMMVARGKGSDLKAIMGISSVSSQTFYWLRSSGIKGPKDFVGKKIGFPAGDVSTAMWPAFARRVGIDPKGVTFVSVAPAAKMSSLKSGVVDVIPYTYDVHDMLLDEFGDSVQFLHWKDIGLNPYGNVLFVKESALSYKREAVDAFVKISQRAFAVCLANYQPCLDAVASSTTGLNLQTELKSWERTKTLLDSPDFRNLALGWIDGARVAKDYELINNTMGIDKAFNPKDAFTTEFLDKSIKLDPSVLK